MQLRGKRVHDAWPRLLQELNALCTCNEMAVLFNKQTSPDSQRNVSKWVQKQLLQALKLVQQILHHVMLFCCGHTISFLPDCEYSSSRTDSFGDRREILLTKLENPWWPVGISCRHCSLLPGASQCLVASFAESTSRSLQQRYGSDVSLSSVYGRSHGPHIVKFIRFYLIFWGTFSRQFIQHHHILVLLIGHHLFYFSIKQVLPGFELKCKTEYVPKLLHIHYDIQDTVKRNHILEN